MAMKRLLASLALAAAVIGIPLAEGKTLRFAFQGELKSVDPTR
jgi:hypothetical protein